MLSPNTILQNRYRVIRQLGQGGMGTVYEAIDERVSCVVAVKETLAAKDGEARRAFEREAALLANLRHASLPKVMDHFTEDSGQFLVMEYVPGYDLAELLEMRGAAFPPSQVLEWADELLKVLEYLHGRTPPILHRDIKPSNLKLTRQGEIFLLDFGLAKGSAGQMQTLLTSRSVRGYTPVYASLEQIHGKGTDPRSDLYSLGATLYHLLTDTPPKDAPTRFDALEDDQTDPLPPIDKLNPQVSLVVATVIQRAMAVSRKSRPANATEMRRALHKAEEETRRAEAERHERLERETHQVEEAARLHAQAEAARKVAAAEAARRREAEGKEQRQQEEAETLRLQEEQRHQRAEEERSRREAGEEETRRREERTKSEQTKAAQTVAAQTQRAKDADVPPAASGLKTMKGEPEQLYERADDLNASPSGETAGGEVVTETGKESKRALIIAAVAAVALISFAIWMMRGGSAPGVNVNRELDGKTSQPTPPAAPTGSRRAPVTNRYGVEMIFIPAGSFEMGSNSGYEEEKPVHRVTFSEGFYMGKYEVTQKQWQAVMGANPSYFKGDNLPVETVSWDDAQEFINRLNEMNDGYKYRLPTEAEWEYAARAGTTGDYVGDLDALAWYGNNAGDNRLDADAIWPNDKGNYSKRIRENGNRTHQVGTKQPNAWGLYDMRGNVWEWCVDYWHNNYNGAPTDGSRWVSGGESSRRVVRGGSWYDLTTFCRSAFRDSATPDLRNTGYGLRLVALARSS